ncbi:MAG: hypothetical protein WEA04_03195 [Candidatus Andersenbacteria bacterium]
MAHNAAFIEEMQAKLTTERDLLKQELGQVAHKQHGDYQADFPNYGRNVEDNATEMADFQALAATTEATEQRLHEVEAALEHIAAGTYGLTANGQAIPEERLRANPAATTIINA